jgi:hypothetical protein
MTSDSRRQGVRIEAYFMYAAMRNDDGNEEDEVRK